MRITIELDAENMRRIQKITGQKKKSPAVNRALSEFIQQHQRRQLESRDVYEAR